MYKNILIATDGSELATKGLSHGLALAKVLGAKVTMVTTTEMWPVLDIAQEAETGVLHPTDEFEKAAATAAQRILAAGADAAKAAGVACETLHVKDKVPAAGIVEVASSIRCDLIVIASHGRRGLQRALLGSVANEVLTHSKVPVLVVRG